MGMTPVLRVTPRSVQQFSVLGTLRNAEPLFTQLAADLQRAVRKNFQAGGRPQRWRLSRRAQERGGKTLIDQALLLNSIYRRNTGSRATVFTRDLRAKIHEFGGRIVPVKAGALAIPLTAEAARRKPRSWDHTFLLKPYDRETGKRTHALICRRNGDGTITALYVLTKSVTMPARPYITPPEEDLVLMGKRVQNWVAGA